MRRGVTQTGVKVECRAGADSAVDVHLEVNPPSMSGDTEDTIFNPHGWGGFGLGLGFCVTKPLPLININSGENGCVREVVVLRENSGCGAEPGRDCVKVQSIPKLALVGIASTSKKKHIHTHREY